MCALDAEFHRLGLPSENFVISDINASYEVLPSAARPHLRAPLAPTPSRRRAALRDVPFAPGAAARAGTRPRALIGRVPHQAVRRAHAPIAAHHCLRPPERSCRRLPTLSWRDPSTGTCLFRCSQPMAGMKRARCGSGLRRPAPAAG